MLLNGCLLAPKTANTARFTAHVFLIEGGIPLKVSTLQNRWHAAIFKAAGLEDFHWHELRHSCASFLARKGAGIVDNRMKFETSVRGE